MKLVKYLFAIWAGVLIYTLLSLLFGSMGLSAYSQLEQEMKKQEVNTERLMEINRDLEDTMNSLLYDKDTLSVYAREQGFAGAREKFIRIVGLSGRRNFANQAGEVSFVADPQYAPDHIIRIIASCTAITILICMAAFDFLKSLKEPL